MRVMKKFGKKLLFAVVIAGATVSGASMALPMPPAGSILVVEYYNVNGDQVGAKVYGTCPTGPYPINWGLTTSVRRMYFYQCQSNDDYPPMD